VQKKSVFKTNIFPFISKLISANYQSIIDLAKYFINSGWSKILPKKIKNVFLNVD